MNLVLMALWDAKIEAYMTPFFAQSVGAAVRSLSDLVNGSGGEAPATHPEDFSLHLFGSWSTDGYFDLKKNPEIVVECSNLKKVRE